MNNDDGTTFEIVLSGVAALKLVAASKFHNLAPSALMELLLDCWMLFHQSNASERLIETLSLLFENKETFSKPEFDAIILKKDNPVIKRFEKTFHERNLPYLNEHTILVALNWLCEKIDEGEVTFAFAFNKSEMVH